MLFKRSHHFVKCLIVQCIYLITFESATLGDTDDVNHFVLGKDVGDGNGLLKVLTGPINLLGDGASIQLDLHDVGLLLTLTKQLHL